MIAWCARMRNLFGYTATLKTILFRTGLTDIAEKYEWSSARAACEDAAAHAAAPQMYIRRSNQRRFHRSP
jgi:hypothetical protein